MSATDIVLLVVTIVALGCWGALALTVVALRREVAQLRAVVNAVEDTFVPALESAANSAELAAHQVARLEDLISVASSVTGTVDSATAATVRVLANPVIKTAAFARGTRRAAKSLTKPEEG